MVILTFVMVVLGFLDDIDELPIAMPISSGKTYALATLLEGN